MGYKESHLNLRGPGSIMEKLFNEAPGLIYEVSGRWSCGEVDGWNAVNSPVEGGEGSWNPITYRVSAPSNRWLFGILAINSRFEGLNEEMFL